jgi:hypothetical protein
MNALMLRGGSRVGPGAYREVRTGHVVYMGTEGYLPGQINSERYVQVPERVYFQERMRRMLRERGVASA